MFWCTQGREGNEVLKDQKIRWVHRVKTKGSGMMRISWQSSRRSWKAVSYFLASALASAPRVKLYENAELQFTNCMNAILPPSLPFPIHATTPDSFLWQQLLFCTQACIRIAKQRVNFIWGRERYIMVTSYWKLPVEVWTLDDFFPQSSPLCVIDTSRG